MTDGGGYDNSSVGYPRGKDEGDEGEEGKRATVEGKGGRGGRKGAQGATKREGTQV